MIRTLEGISNDSTWLGEFARDFHRRFLSLLSYQFRSFPAVTSLSIQTSALSGTRGETSPQTLTKSDLDPLFSPFDLKRLDKYADQMVDYHLILDLLPSIATLYFTRRLEPGVNLSRVQQSILLGIGLQRKSLEDLEKELGTCFIAGTGYFHQNYPQGFVTVQSRC